MARRRRKKSQPTKVQRLERRLAAVEWSLTKAYETNGELQAENIRLLNLYAPLYLESGARVRELLHNIPLPSDEVAPEWLRELRLAHEGVLARNRLGKRVQAALAETDAFRAAKLERLPEGVDATLVRVSRSGVFVPEPPPHTDADAPREAGFGIHGTPFMSDGSVAKEVPPLPYLVDTPDTAAEKAKNARAVADAFFQAFPGVQVESAPAEPPASGWCCGEFATGSGEHSEDCPSGDVLGSPLSAAPGEQP